MNDSRAIPANRNAPCPCGSGQRYKHCCGGLGAPPPATAASAAPYRVKRTFVALGCPRGGTSLLAGALHHAGVFMGGFATRQYEDPDFKLPLDIARDARAVRARLAPVIRARNLDHEYWGWKVPNNIYYIRHVLDLLHNPCFLFIYRDPLAIARSSARHDDRDWESQQERLLEVARSHTQKVRQFQEELRGESHVFRLEEIHAAPGEFAERLARILSPLVPDRARLQEFVDPAGGYH